MCHNIHFIQERPWLVPGKARYYDVVREASCGMILMFQQHRRHSRLSLVLHVRGGKGIDGGVLESGAAHYRSNGKWWGVESYSYW